MEEFNFERDAHLFTLCEPGEGQDPFCKACSEVISGRGQAYEHGKYYDFWIHESCSKLARQIKHSLHPQHLLTLHVNGRFICDGCKYYSEAFTYHCVECGFDLDVKCGLSIAENVHDHQYQILDDEAGKNKIPISIDFTIHRHTLKLCRFRKQHEYPYFPACCDRKISDNWVYICLKCRFVVHESCSKLPLKITHPLHPQHPLNLVSSHIFSRIVICKGCRYPVGGFSFYCKLCEFNIDLKCGLLLDDFFSVNDRALLEERDRKVTIDHFSHKHSLKLCKYFSQIGRKVCCYCHQKIEALAYVCFECDFFIHESCKDAMAEEIQHPYHLNHTLKTYTADYGFTKYSCDACRNHIETIGLCCKSCFFFLHHVCATPFKRPLKHKCHEHALFYFSYYENRSDDTCSICNDYLGDGPFYGCLECNDRFGNYFGVHMKCIPLPLVVVEDKHIHDHPLTLSDSLEKHDFEVYYCDICEEEGNPKHHLYHCEECEHKAHIDCVITELDETSLEDSENGAGQQ